MPGSQVTKAGPCGGAAASHGIGPEISPAADSGHVPGRARRDGPGTPARDCCGRAVVFVMQKKALSTAKRGRRHGANHGFTVIAPATCGYTDHAPRRVPLAEDAQHGSQGRADSRAPADSVPARAGSRRRSPATARTISKIIRAHGGRQYQAASPDRATQPAETR